MLIVLVLSVIGLQIYSAFIPRIARTRCTANLTSLHVAADLYLQEHRTWPQIAVKDQSPEQYATAWISALGPYGMTPEGWVCPTTQSRSGSPNLHDPQNVRIDYLPTPFRPGQQWPFRWANQPWFAERFNEHRTGNLMVFPDGHVESMNEVMNRIKPGSAPAN